MHVPGFVLCPPRVFIPDQGFFQIGTGRVRKVAEHLMESPEAQLRIAAAREMRKIDPPTFQQFLQMESKAWVREAAKRMSLIGSN
ncbi:MAG: hypothetical protein CM15mP66_12900 [Pseudomonadota bacterium]|nr:MAG: hypothetical protein CM15mP66_12900 [Pseudomonadota bacterium]